VRQQQLVIRFRGGSVGAAVVAAADAGGQLLDSYEPLDSLGLPTPGDEALAYIAALTMMTSAAPRVQAILVSWPEVCVCGNCNQTTKIQTTTTTTDRRLAGFIRFASRK